MGSQYPHAGNPMSILPGDAGFTFGSRGNPWVYLWVFPPKLIYFYTVYLQGICMMRGSGTRLVALSYIYIYPVLRIVYLPNNKFSKQTPETIPQVMICDRPKCPPTGA